MQGDAGTQFTRKGFVGRWVLECDDAVEHMAVEVIFLIFRLSKLRLDGTGRLDFPIYRVRRLLRLDHKLDTITIETLVVPHVAGICACLLGGEFKYQVLRLACS